MRALISLRRCKVAASDRPVISDTTPIINPIGIGQFHLLSDLYARIWIPHSVFLEYSAGAQPSEPDLTKLPWISIIPAVTRHPGLPVGLGVGEADTISLALANQARAVLIDEALARRVARSLDLPITGTLGVLVAAKRAGFIPEIKTLIDLMSIQGRHISAQLRYQVLRAANEEDESDN
jgi:predicted nucleic acid-binding protein